MLVEGLCTNKIGITEAGTLDRHESGCGVWIPVMIRLEDVGERKVRVTCSLLLLCPDFHLRYFRSAPVCALA